jgi:diguanylate cyclase (GGDEF)-like protein/PAS domain S-box-containing protein
MDERSVISKAAAEAALRQRAENFFREKVEQSPQLLSALSPEASQLMLHELHVRQIELRLQNEDLHRSQLEIDAARLRYIELYEFSPVAYCTTSATGKILQSNLAAASLLCQPPDALLGQYLLQYIYPQDQQIYTELRQQLSVPHAPTSCQLRIVKSRLKPCWVQLTITVTHHSDGSVNHLITLADIHAQKQQELDLKDELDRVTLIAENIPGMFAYWDNNLRCRYSNSQYLKWFGRTPEQMQGIQIQDLMGPILFQKNESYIRNVLLGDDQQFERTITMPDGVVGHTWVHYLAHKIDGIVQGFYSMTLDITALKIAEEKLRFTANVFTHAREAIMIISVDGSILDVNDAFVRITGYSRVEVLGKNSKLLSSGRHEKTFFSNLRSELIAHGYWSGEICIRRKDGELFFTMQTISSVLGDDGKISQYVVLMSDISLIKAQKSELERMAHFDQLTGLPNRTLLMDRLHQGLVHAQRNKKISAVIFLDLDGFKAINDQHGHEAGDQVLVTVASRMNHVLREGDTLARLGGDEFVVVLIDLAQRTFSFPILNRLLAAAAKPIQFGDAKLQVSASLGVSFYPQDDEIDKDQLLRQADQAMYQAKLAGKNRYHIFDAEHDRSARGHSESIEYIRLALERNEFVLYYQPKVNMRTGAVIGAEALIRWQHPRHGLVSPAVFLPVIENHPLAVSIGEWVIESVLLQLEIWHAMGLAIPISVNVGAQQLLKENFAERLGEILARHPRVQPNCLELEVLETSALEDMARVSGVIEACLAYGVMFSLDDFGAGYSSLTYLKRLPVTMLKIDQSFVHNMLEDPDDLAILDAVIGLTSAFRRDVIAEGVETVEHAAMLLQLGCEMGQGYGIARPMAAHLLPQWASKWKPDPMWCSIPKLNRDELALLFVCVEQRAWIKTINYYLMGDSNTPPNDYPQTYFAAWRQNPTQLQGGEHSKFSEIIRLHQQMQTVASDLFRLKAEGSAIEKNACLQHFQQLGRDFFTQMQQIFHGNRR